MPAPPDIESVPVPPSITLSLLLPVRVSLPVPPMMFSMDVKTSVPDPPASVLLVAVPPARLTVTARVLLAYETVSLPAPPSKVSLPAPPIRVSLPVIPFKLSLPLPPVSRLFSLLPVRLKALAPW